MRKYCDKLATLLFITLFILTACNKENNPIAPLAPADVNAVGCLIKSGDVELVRTNVDSVYGEFLLEERVQTPLFSFYFVDKNGNLFQPQDEKLILAWDVKNQMVADVIQYETDGLWNFHLKGYEAGNTSVRFKVMDEKFESLDIPITVIVSSGGGLAK